MRTIGPYFACSLLIRGAYSPEMTCERRQRLVHPNVHVSVMLVMVVTRMDRPARKGPGYFFSGDVCQAT